MAFSAAKLIETLEILGSNALPSHQTGTKSICELHKTHSAEGMLEIVSPRTNAETLGRDKEQ